MQQDEYVCLALLSWNSRTLLGALANQRWPLFVRHMPFAVADPTPNLPVQVMMTTYGLFLFGTSEYTATGLHCLEYMLKP